MASDLVNDRTATFFKTLLRNDTADYLAGVATWADSIRYTKWGHFTGIFHFIDAKDSPPAYCGVDLERDCKEAGCIVTAIRNYTTRLMDAALPAWDHAQSAKFVVHFLGDIHQPLHDEDVARGGNGIYVQFGGRNLSLHHVWDSELPEAVAPAPKKTSYPAARAWATRLGKNIVAGGKWASVRGEWLAGMDLGDPIASSLAWAREGNGYVCTHGKKRDYLPSISPPPTPLLEVSGFPLRKPC